MGQLIAAAIAENNIAISPSSLFDSTREAVPFVASDKPEFVLLLTIAKIELTVSEQSLIDKLLSHTLDWDNLLSMASMHGLEPLLFHHLGDRADEVAPDEVMQKLRKNCRLIALRNLVLSAKLRDIAAHLTSHQIEYIAYKGPLLAETYGGDSALRTYRDLDLLVHQEQLCDVRDALREIGFVDRYSLSEAQQDASFRSGFEHPFTLKAGIDLDVHWHIVQEFKSSALDMNGMWRRKTTAPLLGQNVPAFSPEDLLLVLCLHAGHHGWMQLSHMCDLAQLFRVHRNFDWDIVRSHLRDSNTRRIVCISLYLLEKHWHVDIPAEIEALISADSHVKRLATRIETDIWPSKQPALTTTSLTWLLDRSAGEGIRDRARLLAGSIFVPAIEDFAIIRLPTLLSPLYTGLRVLRLTWRCISLQVTGMVGKHEHRNA